MIDQCTYRLIVALLLFAVCGSGCVRLEEPVCQPCEKQSQCGPQELCDVNKRLCIPRGTCYCPLGERTCTSLLCEGLGDVCTHPAEQPAGLCAPSKACLTDADCLPLQECAPGPQRTRECRFRYLCSEPNECNDGDSRPCETGKAGNCASGVQSCQSGKWLSCVSDKARPEVCNGLDDDCDGKIDNGIRCVETFAGLAGPGGYIDGPKDQARFRSPRALAIGPNGEVYVADSGNHAIRKIDKDGGVSTLAGDGQPGVRDGDGKAARFQNPSGLVFDKAGNLYVADTGNHRIRKITPGGAVSTLAGGNRGSSDGKGDMAGFVRPFGMSIDPQGHLYVADSGNHMIRKISPDGVVTTVAGIGQVGYRDGKAKLAMFNGPHGVLFAADGSLYITDKGSHLIRWLDPSGQVRTFAGGFQQADWVDEVGLRARFSAPSGILQDSLGFLLVADVDNHVLRRINPQGRVTTLAGSGSSGTKDSEALSASFRFPFGIAQASAERLLIADTDNNTIRVMITYPR